MNEQMKRYQQLKSQVDSLKRKKAEAEGTLRYLQSQLKDEFGCDDLAQAEKKLSQLKKQVQKSKRAYEKALAEFEEKWNDVLNEIDD